MTALHVLSFIHDYNFVIMSFSHVRIVCTRCAHILFTSFTVCPFDRYWTPDTFRIAAPSCSVEQMPLAKGNAMHETFHLSLKPFRMFRFWQYIPFNKKKSIRIPIIKLRPRKRADRFTFPFSLLAHKRVRPNGLGVQLAKTGSPLFTRARGIFRREELPVQAKMRTRDANEDRD